MNMDHNSSHYSIDLRKKTEAAAFEVPKQETVVHSPVKRARARKGPPFVFRMLAFMLVVGITIAPLDHVFANEEVSAPEPAPVAEEVPAPEPPAEPDPQPEPVVEEVAQEEVVVPEEVVPSGDEALNDQAEEMETVGNEEGSEEIIEGEDTNGDSSEESETETVEDSEEDSQEGESDEEVVSDEETEDEEVDEAEEEVAVEDDSSEEVSEEEEEEGATEEESGTTNEEETENAEVGGGGSGTVSSESAATSTPSEVVVVQEVVVEEEVDEPAPLYSFAANDSQYVFNEAECTVVDDGAFYCVRGSDVSTEELTPSPVENVTEVFAEKDTDGDLEIFFRADGGNEKITDNAFDDDAPVYDSVSGLIVWHALVDDRYQIFVHDRASRTVRQITDTTYNNTNPDVSGDTIVWQGWEDENWEIFTVSYDELTSSEEVIAPERLTVNQEHDMFPKVHDGFVTWQSQSGGEWRSYGHNVETEAQVYLGAGTDGSVESARLVLLVEKRNANGDIERVGYEVDTGEAIPLGSTPKELPESPVIPEDPIKDQTGILPSSSATSTPKTTSKDNADGDGVGGDTPPPEEE